MTRRRPIVELMVVLGLIALVGALAALQYRWLGQVSDAERARLHASLEQHAADFATDVDREITLAYMRFQTAGQRLTQGDVAGFADQVDTWSHASDAALVRDVYRVTPAGTLVRYRPDARSFEPVAWPPELAALRPIPPQNADQVKGPAPPLREPVETFMSSIPALLVPLPAVRQLPSRDALFTYRDSLFTFRLGPEYLVLWFDRGYLTRQLLPSLADRHFPVGSDVRLTIVDVRDPSRPIFGLGSPAVTPDRADASADLFALRPELIDPTAAPGVHAAGGRGNIFVQARSTSRGEKPNTALRAVGGAHWRLFVQPASGSLDTLVAGERRRNLMLSFGMLLLLGASVGILLTMARRSQRLAARQMEFVATISHELRTPLAVIRSAAQNLSAGVIDEPDRARRYGELIDAEGRRLGGMVEQILQFAGLSAARPLAIQPVNVDALVRELASACEPLCHDGHVRMDLECHRPDAIAAANPEALRTALHNLIANAIKHGADGGWVRVAVATDSSGARPVVRIVVTDAGRGIAAEDLPHIFEPFYRGRDAVDRQLRGNGLGLALVKRIAAAHTGDVSVHSTAGHGAAFTLEIPAASALHDRSSLKSALA